MIATGKMFYVSHYTDRDKKIMGILYRNMICTVSYAFDRPYDHMIVSYINRMFEHFEENYDIVILVEENPEVESSYESDDDIPSIGSSLSPICDKILEKIKGIKIRVREKYVSSDDSIQEEIQILALSNSVGMVDIKNLDLKNSKCIYTSDVYRQGDVVHKISDKCKIRYMEASILSTLRCQDMKHINKIRNLVYYNGCIIGYSMNYYQNGTLSRYCYDNMKYKLDYKLLKGWFLDIVDTVNELHKRDILHLDVSAFNSVIDKDLNVYLIDINCRRREPASHIKYRNVSEKYDWFCVVVMMERVYKIDLSHLKANELLNYHDIRKSVLV